MNTDVNKFNQIFEDNFGKMLLYVSILTSTLPTIVSAMVVQATYYNSRLGLGSLFGLGWIGFSFLVFKFAIDYFECYFEQKGFGLWFVYVVGTILITILILTFPVVIFEYLSMGLSSFLYSLISICVLEYGLLAVIDWLYLR